MKTGLGMVQDGKTAIDIPAITAVITGDIYLYKRPQNSMLEDIVINSLAMSGEQLQTGVFNVNIHAPNLNATFDNIPDNTMPDLERLSVIETLVTDVLKDYIGLDFRIWIDQPGTPIKDDDGTWYINIRVNYKYFQKHFTNI